MRRRRDGRRRSGGEVEDLVGERDHVGVVGRDDEGLAGGHPFSDRREYVARGRAVEFGGRLVDDDERRPLCERHGERRARELTAGQLGGTRDEPIRQTEQLEQPQRGAGREMLLERQLRKEIVGRALRDVPHLAAPKLIQLPT